MSAVPERPWLQGVLQVLADDHLVVGGVRFERTADAVLEIEGEPELGTMVRVEFELQVTAEGAERPVAHRLGPAVEAAASTTAAHTVEIIGVVEAIDEGAITVSGQVIALRTEDAPTVIEGDLQIGTRVRVQALQTDAGLAAERVVVLSTTAEAPSSTTPQPAG